MAVIAADPSNLVAVGPNRPSSEKTRRGFRVPTPASSSAASGRGTAPRVLDPPGRLHHQSGVHTSSSFSPHQGEPQPFSSGSPGIRFYYAVTCILFKSTSDNYFISGCIDGMVRIWDVPRCLVVDWADRKEIITAVINHSQSSCPARKKQAAPYIICPFVTIK